MKKIKRIKFWQLLLLLLFVGTNALAQTTTYSFSPALDVWTDASRSGNTQPRYQIICPANTSSSNPYTYYGDILKWKLKAKNGNILLFEVRKIDGTAFSNGATINVRERVCDSPWAGIGINLGTATATTGSRVVYVRVDLPLNFTSGTKELKLVVEDNFTGGILTRAWGGIITVTAVTTNPPAICGTPSNTSETNIQEDRATLNWNNGTNNSSAYIQYRVQGTSIWQEQTASGTSKTISGLNPNTTYEWRVKGSCLNGDSGWSNIDTFITLPMTSINCNPPNPRTGTVTSSTAMIDWQAMGNTTGYVVRIRRVGQTSWEIQQSTGTTTSFNATGLQPNTRYECQVASICGDQRWSTSIFFTTEEVTGQPSISISPSRVDYGNILLWQTETRTVDIRNIGGSPLVVANIISSNGQFVIQSATSGSIPAGGSMQVEIAFTPGVRGVESGRIVVESNDPRNSSAIIEVVGFGVSPVIEVNPVSLDFGNVEVGSSNSLTLTISNYPGDYDLMINGLSVTNSDFTYTPINANVSQGGAVTTVVTFSPSTQGLIEAELIITSNDPTFPTKRVPLKGTGETPQNTNCLIIPFPAGVIFTPTQGPGGGTSHNPGSNAEYAWDFAAPRGTPFAAVISGEIVIVVDNFPDDNCRDRSCINNVNRIVIRGDDGFDYLYLHHTPNSARVVVGQRVNQGDILAGVGSSGYSTGDHLHLQKQNPSNSYYSQSLPMEFDVNMTLWNQYSASGICGTVNSAGTGGAEIPGLLLKADNVSVAMNTVSSFSVRVTGVDVETMAGIQGDIRLPIGAINIGVVSLNPAIRNFRERIIDNADGSKTVRFLLSDASAFGFTADTQIFDIEFELDNNFTEECAVIDILEGSLRAANDNSTGNNSMEVSAFDGEICKLQNVVVDFLIIRSGDNAPINNVSILDATNTEITITNASGEAQTEILAGSDFSATFSKAQLDEYWGVVEVGDIVRAEQIAFDQIGTPMEFLIADVNADGFVDVGDVVILRNAAWDDITEYPNGKRDWNFVKLLSNTPNEYPDFTEEVNIPNIQADILVDDYEAYVAGDFNFDASTSRLQSLPLRREVEIDNDGNYIVRYTLQEPFILHGYEMEMNGLSNVLSVNSAVSDMNEQKMYKEKGNSLRLMSYNSLEEVTLEAGTVLLEIKAEKMKDLKEVHFSYVSSSSGLALAPVDVLIDKSDIYSDFVVYPNPAPNKEFSFLSPEDGIIAIYSSNGSLILEREIKKGKNDISLKEAASGMYTILFSSPSNSHIARLVIE